MSTHSSSIKDHKRLVIRNPDGTCAYLFKHGEVDSIVDLKEKEANALKEHQQNLNELTMSDDELQYLIDHADQFNYYALIEQVLDVFRSYRLLFLVTLLLDLSLMMWIMFSTFENKEYSITMMEDLYRDVSAEEASRFFNVIFIFLFIINMIFYPLGFYSISLKKVKLLKYLALFSLYTAVSTVFVIYINILFIFIFVFRLALYTLSRFVVNLLISIILIPTRQLLTQNLNPQNLNYGSV